MYFLHLPAWHSVLLLLYQTRTVLVMIVQEPPPKLFPLSIKGLFLKFLLSHCVFVLVLHSLTCKRVCPSTPFPRRSWRTLRRRRACLRRRRSPSCLVSWPWWTCWCLPAPSTSARSRQRRTCRQEGWWGSACDWVCACSTSSGFTKNWKSILSARSFMWIEILKSIETFLKWLVNSS